VANPTVNRNPLDGAGRSLTRPGKMYPCVRCGDTSDLDGVSDMNGQWVVDSCSLGCNIDSSRVGHCRSSSGRGCNGNVVLIALVKWSRNTV
jgi:hypothetical protein